MNFRTNLSKERNIPVSALYAVLFLGLIIGSIFNTVIDLKHYPIILTQNVAPINADISLLDSFKCSLCVYIAFLSAFTLTGLFTFGQVFSVLLLAFRGFAMGFSICSVYTLLGAKAIIPLAVVVLPKLIAVSVIFVLGAREAVRLSSNLFSFLFFGKNDDDIKNKTRLYFIKFSILAVFAVVTATAESALTYFFIDLF